MNLSDLTKPQWDAAIAVARILTTCSPDREDDRARFRRAKSELTALLPADASVNEIIGRAVRWTMLDAIGEVCAGAGLRLERVA